MVVVTIELTEDQVLYFRALRGHLAGPGAPSAVAAARSIIGAQAQQLPPSLLALSLRTRGRPTAAKLKAQVVDLSPKLVRTCGQRGTLHLYDAAADWAQIVAAGELWTPGARGSPLPTNTMLDKALAKVSGLKRPVTRTDLLGVAPRSFERALAERARMAGMDERRLAAARLIWYLAHRGDACVVDKVGTEQTYALRSLWFPKLAWKPMAPLDAAREMALRYLGVYGPATAADLAHFFGAKVTNVRQWLDPLEAKLVPVRCGDRNGLVALGDDVADLSRKPPTAATQWPLRLLPLWESMLMAHADKSWTVPDEADRKIIWRKGAYVAAVALARGRAVAIWSQTKRTRRLAIEVNPLSRWSKSKHLAPLKREADAVAAHLDLEGADVTVTG